MLSVPHRSCYTLSLIKRMYWPSIGIQGTKTLLSGGGGEVEVEVYQCFHFEFVNFVTTTNSFHSTPRLLASTCFELSDQ
jgi:hypothetical protein